MFINAKVFNNLWRIWMASAVDRLFGRQVPANTERAPALNVWEDETAFYIEADLPDVSADKLEVTSRKATG